MSRAPAPESTDTRLLEIAANHIRLHGLERTKIVSIARTAGMSHANVYRYFPSKEALIDAVTDQWLKPVEAGLRDIADAPDPAYDKIERMLSVVFRAYRNKVEADPNIFVLLVEAARADRAIARRHRSRVQHEFQRVVEEGMANRLFEQSDVKRAVALIFDVAHRFLEPASTQQDATISRNQIDLRFERVARVLVRVLSVGIRERL